MCVTAHVHITVRTPVALARPMQRLNALHRYVTCTHPVMSLMNLTGDDIDYVILVTSTPLRGVSIKLTLSKIGHFDE